MSSLYEDNKLSKFIENNKNILNIGQDIYLIFLDEIYNLYNYEYKIFKDRINEIDLEKNIIHLELMPNIITKSNNEIKSENILAFQNLKEAKLILDDIKSNLNRDLEEKLESISFFRPVSEYLVESTELNKSNKKLKKVFENIPNVGTSIYIYNPENNKSNSYNLVSISLIEDSNLIDIIFEDKDNEKTYRAKADVIENKIYFNDKEFLFFKNSEDLFQHINESKELILKL